MPEIPKTPFDDFKTVGELTGERRRRTPLSGWLWLTFGAFLVGLILGGLVYVGFEFWRGAPTRRHRGVLRRMAQQSLIEHPISTEELNRRIMLSALAGGAIGLVVGAGYSLSAARRARREENGNEGR